MKGIAGTSLRGLTKKKKVPKHKTVKTRQLAAVAASKGIRKKHLKK